MADLEFSPIVYREGDPYPPMAFNRVTHFSAVHYAAALTEHTDEGEHKPPFVAVAGAHVNWTGTAYVLGPAKGVLSVSAVGSDEVQIVLSTNRHPKTWAVIAWVESPGEAGADSPDVPAEVEGSKTSNTVTLRLPAAGAFSFLVVAQR